MKKTILSLGILTLSVCMNLSINAQVIRTIAGSHTYGDSGDGGLAIHAKCGDVSGIVTDAKGNIYISDYGNAVVRKITTAGIITTIAGTGFPSYSGDDGLAVNAELYLPFGLAFDSYGNLYIADNGNSVIRKIDTFGIITTVAGNGNWGFSGDGGLATNATINGGMAITFDRNDNMYIADGNVLVRKVDRFGIISTIAGSGLYGYGGDGGSATAAALAGPQGVAVDTLGNIYISDALNNVIRKINTSGIISTIARASYPHGIIVDAMGDIIFADQNNNRIRKINAGGLVSTIAGNGIGEWTGDGGLPINAGLITPGDMFINNRGNLVIADEGNFVVREVLYSGTHITVTPGATFCAGTVATFTANSTNEYYGCQYRWTVNGMNVTIDTNICINNDLHHGDIVNCYLADPYSGFVIDSTAGIMVGVNPYVTPAINITASTGAVIAEGTTVTFTSAVTNGGTAPTYQWQINDVDISGETAATFTTNALSTGDSVTCIIIGNAPCSMFPNAESNNLVASERIVTTGFDENKKMVKNTRLTISPNPNNGVFTIQGSTNPMPDESVNYIVTDMLGRIVYNSKLQVQNGIINSQINLANDLSAGLYLLRVNTHGLKNELQFVVEK